MCLLVACDPKPKQEPSAYENAMETLESGDIVPGPIRHAGISDELDARIRNFAAVFAEVYPISHQEWLDGFRRDTVPENEVAIWEHMASAYTGFPETNEVDAAARKEAFGLLLVRSNTADVESRFTELKELTVDQAENLITQYEAAPKPVTLQSAEKNAAPDP